MSGDEMKVIYAHLQGRKHAATGAQLQRVLDRWFLELDDAQRLSSWLAFEVANP